MSIGTLSWSSLHASETNGRLAMQAGCSVADAVPRASSVVCVTLRGAAPSEISPRCIGTNVAPRSARGSSQIGSQEAR